MSGSGGYYKYRCKYWLSHDCPHWVWVNNSPCPHCLAKGLESVDTSMSDLHTSREVYVPQIENGTLHYIMMEIVAGGPGGMNWTSWVPKPAPIQQLPLTTTEPSAVGMTSTSFDPQHSRPTGTHSAYMKRQYR